MRTVFKDALACAVERCGREKIEALADSIPGASRQMMASLLSKRLADESGRTIYVSDLALMVDSGCGDKEAEREAVKTLFALLRDEVFTQDGQPHAH